MPLGRPMGPGGTMWYWFLNSRVWLWLNAALWDLGEQPWLRDCFLTDPNQKLSCTFVAEEEEGALDDALILFLLRLSGPPTLGELMMSTWRGEVAAVWRNVSSWGGTTPIMGGVKLRQQLGCCWTWVWTRANWTTVKGLKSTLINSSHHHPPLLLPLHNSK